MQYNVIILTTNQYKYVDMQKNDWYVKIRTYTDAIDNIAEYLTTAKFNLRG